MRCFFWAACIAIQTFSSRALYTGTLVENLALRYKQTVKISAYGLFFGSLERPISCLIPLIYFAFCPFFTSKSCPLAATQPDGLAVFLQLRDKLIALADDVLVLLVLVVWPIRLDDTLTGDAVDGAGDATAGDELGEIPVDDQSVLWTSTYDNSR
jgi:hypothetical protein